MPLTAQRSYDITPGNDLADNAGFIPLSVLVDNYSPYWLLLQDAGRYVPPYTSGVVLPLIHADTNRATWTNPPLSGLSTQSYVSTAGFAHLTYVAEVLAYSAGSSVPNSALSQQQAYSVAEGGTLNVTLPFLAQGVRIDNPGGTCYTIIGTNLIIPPWTTAWLANFTTPFNNITIQPIANPNGTPNNALGGPLVTTFYAQQVASSGGTPYIPPSLPLKFLQTGSSSGNSLSRTVNITPVSGDLLIAVTLSNGNDVPSTPSGWNLVYGPATGGGTNYTAVFTKIADGTEGSSITFTNALFPLKHLLICEYANLPKGGVQQTLIQANISGTSTLPTETLSSVYTPWMFLYIWAVDAANITVTTPPSGFIRDGTISDTYGSNGILRSFIGITGNVASGTGVLSGSSSGQVIAVNFI